MQKRIPLFVVVMIVASLCASTALAFGPYGPPMSTLEHGQWAWDIGYTQEEKDVAGCATWYESYFVWSDPNWVPTTHPGDASGGYCLRLLDFELDAVLASIEYGLCDNWDIFLRLGMAKASAEMASTSWAYVTEGVDFDWGFAWQVGTNFTICQNGPWTWGGRLQYGSADPDGDSWTYRYGDPSDPNSSGATDACKADIELYEALAFIGPTYQPDETWLLYSAIGWQCERITMDYSCDYISYYLGDPESRWMLDERAKLKHYSVVGLFGGAWMPNDKARVSADVLIGEAGKFGWSVVGQFPF
jgi:hypothetical protein